MSYELLFFKQKDAIINLNDVVAFFSEKDHFLVKPLDTNKYQFEYKNPKTSVSFKISYDEQDELITELTYDEHFIYCFTVFSMNYTRPSFYALEAMPIVVEFSQKFNLYINDVQSIKEERNALKLYTVDELIQSYFDNNKIACIEFNKQFPLNTTSIEKTNYYYHYSSLKEHLTESFDTVVPDISFLKNKETQDISTIFTWDNAMASIIPICDYVLILRHYKGFLGMKKQKLSLVPFNEIISFFSEEFIKINEQSITLYQLPKTNNSITERFYQLPENDFTNYELINVDEIIDVAVNE